MKHGSYTKDYPRVRHLPKAVRRRFLNFLKGRERPHLEGVAPEEQDGYFNKDYEAFCKRDSQ